MCGVLGIRTAVLGWSIVGVSAILGNPYTNPVALGYSNTGDCGSGIHQNSSSPGDSCGGMRFFTTRCVSEGRLLTRRILKLRFLD